MNERQRQARLRWLRGQIAQLERQRDKTPNGEARDNLSEKLDNLRDLYEDTL